MLTALKRIICLMILVSIHRLYAQSEIEQILPLSPEAAAVVRYGEVPVNEFTGVPNIGIPLFNIESGSISLPLSLSYHAGGNKVETIAPWVGMGWSLSSFPSISRSVQGLADEEAYFSGNAYEGFTVRELYNFEESQATENDYTNFLAGLQEGVRDSQPDIFYYSIPGESGKFYYNQDIAEFVTYPRSNTLIEKMTVGFKLTTASGLIYMFNEEELTQVVTGSNSSTNTTSSWYPSSITSHNGIDTIEFDYRLEINSFSVRSKVTKFQKIGGEGSLKFNTSGSYSHTHQIVGKKVSKISFDDGYVLFKESETQREDLNSGFSLGNLFVYNNSNDLLKKFSFSYEYLTGSGFSPTCFNEPDSKKWMVLAKVKQESTDGSEAPLIHTLTYNENGIPPCRQSAAQDYWGYYNGEDLNENLIPRTVTKLESGQVVSIPGADRNVGVNDEAQFGILTKIKYPLGGFTEFTYENNFVDPESTDPIYLSSTVVVGGDADVHGNPADGVTGQGTSVDPYTKQFTIDNPPNLYLNGEHIDGGAVIKIQLIFPSGCPQTGESNSCAYFRIRKPSDPSLTYPLTVDTEYHLPNGDYQIVADFDNVPSYDAFFVAITWESIGSSSGIAGGLRVKELKTFESGSSEPIITEYKYTECYDCEASSGDIFSSYKHEYRDIIGVTSYVSLAGTWLPPTTATYLRLNSYSNIEQVSFSGSSVGYDKVYVTKKGNDQALVMEKNFNHIKDAVSTIFPYPPTENLEAFRGVLLSEINYLTTSAGLDSVNFVNNTYGFHTNPEGAFGLKFGDIVIYEFSDDDGNQLPPSSHSTIPPTHYPQVIVPYTLDSKWSQMDADEQVYIRGSDTLKTSSSYFYDPDYQLLSRKETIDSKGDILKTAYNYPFSYPYDANSIPGKLKDANLITIPIETISSVNNDVISAAATSFDETYLLPSHFHRYPSQNIVSFSESSDGSTFSSYQLETEIIERDDLGNILEYIQTNGIPTTILWGYDQTLPIAQILNATHAQVEAILGENYSFSDGGLTSDQEANLRSIAGTQVTTYEYDQGVGLIKQTDPNGIQQEYDYDGFNRLKLVKDEDGNIVRFIDYQLGGSN